MGDTCVYLNMGVRRPGIEVCDWLKQIKNHSIGEVCLTSVNHDGTNMGVDWDLVKITREYINVPLVYGGGFNPDTDDLAKLENWVEGIAIASALHYKRFKPAAFSERCKL